MCDLQTVASWFTIFGVIIALIALCRGVREFSLSNKRQAAEKAIDGARIFKSDILPNITFLESVYLSTGYLAFMKQHMGTQENYEFTDEEYRELFSDEERKLISSYHSKINEVLVTGIGEKVPPIQSRNIESINSDSDAKEYVRAVRVDTLNTLEWLCMMYTSSVANASQVYQSLHMLFIKFIGLEYPNIALMNENSYDKYYTNIIKTYNDWLSKYKQDKRKEEKTRIEGKLKTNRLLKRRIKTSPTAYDA